MLGGRFVEGCQINARVLKRRGKEKYAELGGDVGVLERVEGGGHRRDYPEVQSDPDNAPIRNWPEVRWRV
jgi:hypothetical protein